MKDFWGKSKVDYAIELLRKHEPKEGYYLAFSGGKDSVCIERLKNMAGVKSDDHYHLTTVDPPELVKFIREKYPMVSIERPVKTMWQLIVDNGIPPLRTIRYCCRILKERGGTNRTTILGIRKYESRNRMNRKEVEDNRNGGIIVSPILNWTDEDVWDFIRNEKIPYCGLYDDGFKRLGCVLCPFNSRRREEAKRWPKIAEEYRRACIRAYDPDVATSWKDGNEMYEWWLTGKAHKETPWFT